MTDETTNVESIDQPAVDSELTEQPTEESQDQPTEEVEEAESDESEIVEIDGEEFTPAQLKEFVNKGKDYTRKTQQLADERREIEAERQRFSQGNQQPATQEDDEITQAKATLRKYNVAFAEDVDRKIRESQIRAKLDMDFDAFQREHNLEPEMAALVKVAGNAYNISYKEAYEKYWGGNTKVVKRKIVGARKTAVSPVSGKSGGGITRADIANMSPEKYEQLANSGRLDEMIRNGELQ